MDHKQIIFKTLNFYQKQQDSSVIHCFENRNKFNYCSEPINVVFQFVPKGFYYLLTKIRNDYHNPPVLVTENGFATRGGLQDDDRVTYYRHYISALLDAIAEGSDIRAYTAWSMMDNFEWAAGYTYVYIFMIIGCYTQSSAPCIFKLIFSFPTRSIQDLATSKMI